MEPIKPWWASKMIWIGIITALVAAVNTLTETVTDPRILSIAATLVGLLTVILRVLTDKPIGKPEEPRK